MPFRTLVLWALLSVLELTELQEFPPHRQLLGSIYGKLLRAVSLLVWLSVFPSFSSPLFWQ